MNLQNEILLVKKSLFIIYFFPTISRGKSKFHQRFPKIADSLVARSRARLIRSYWGTEKLPLGGTGIDFRDSQIAVERPVFYLLSF